MRERAGLEHELSQLNLERETPVEQARCKERFETFRKGLAQPVRKALDNAQWEDAVCLAILHNGIRDKYNLANMIYLEQYGPARGYCKIRKGDNVSIKNYNDILYNLVIPRIKNISAQELPQDLVVTADVLNVRDSPSLQGNIIGSLRKGQVVSWLASSSDGRWNKMQIGSLIGWIFYQYAKRTSLNWEGGNIFLGSSIFNDLQKILGKDGPQIRFVPLVRNLIDVKIGTRAQKVNLSGMGTLEMNVNMQNPGFLASFLKDIVQSKERVVIAIDATIKLVRHEYDNNQKIVSKITDWILLYPGQTWVSQDLQKKVYAGSLIPSQQILAITSPYENLSVIYLHKSLATKTTVAHELLGHFYLAIKGIPFDHKDSLIGKGILGASGQPFDKSVLDFIETQVVAEAKKNLKSGSKPKP